jgi:hypothetical protein
LSIPTSKPSTTGAKAALDGFEYQLNVSVLMALQLMLITKSATQITLEPANDEDLEVDLEPETPGRVQPKANMTEGYKLVVQVKLRNSGPWSIEAFKALLKHGKRRRPARQHLDDPNTRYLLISNADATGKARDLLVRGLEEWPEKRIFPPSLKSTLPHSPEGRVALWGGLAERFLDLEIGDILSTLLRVPQSRSADCRDRLKEEALQRMRGTTPGVWTREDLLDVIRSFGGYLASAPQLEAFVPPTNFNDLLNTLRRKNAVVVTGPSGTGKTWAALALVDQVKQRPSAPEVIQVNVNNGPSSTRTLTDTGPKLFYIEDPWGQNSLLGGSDIWTDQLPRLLRDAHAGQQFVITSRTDMLNQAKADKGLKPWSVVLDADQYRDGELKNIYNKRLELLPTNLQAKALDFRKGALDALETPYEVDLFFTHLADGPEPKEADQAFYRRILALAHRDAVEDVVVGYLDASDSTGASAIVWALLAARSQFDRNQLVNLSRQLRILDPPLADSIEKLVNRLVATRHLRQPGQTVSFSHPSVKAGFETHIKENLSRSEAVFASLISALTRLGGSQQKWSMETAARCLKSIIDLLSDINHTDLEFEIDDISSGLIDGWLEESLIDPQADFRSVLHLASDVGTTRSNPSELARWFIKSIRRGGQLFMKEWMPPIFDDDWYERISSDTRSFVIADRFVRERLPQDRDGFGEGLARKLDRIALGLTPAFTSAARKLVTSGFDGNVSTIAVGAVRDLEGYEPVLDAALEELTRINKFFEEDGKEQWRAIRDGECDEAHEEGYQTHHEDDGYAAGVFVETYVNQIRTLGQWQSLCGHPRVSEMGRAWADDIAKTAGSVSVEELRAVMATTRSGEYESRAWDAAREHWHPELAPDLEQRLLSNAEDDRLRVSLAYCAMTKSPSTLIRCFEQVCEPPSTFVQLLVDFHAASSLSPKKKRKRLLNKIKLSISEAGIEIFEALSTKKKPPTEVAEATLSLLCDAAEIVRPSVLKEIVPVMVVSGGTPAKTIRRWLLETTDYQFSQAAAQSAVAIEDDDLVWLALKHARAGAREVAINYLASKLPDPLPQSILNLCYDPSSLVRRALVNIISSRPHSNHYDTLLHLIDDNWSDSPAYHNEHASYPIATRAIAGIAKYERLPDDVGRRLLQIAERTDDRGLGIVALNTAAQCCGPDVRSNIWKLSFLDQPSWFRVDAVDSLIWAEVVEQEILDAISAKLILQLPPPLAASSSVLLAVHGQVDAVVKTMERIAHSSQSRALVLLGAYGLSDRDFDAAQCLLGLLGKNHLAQGLLNLTEDEKLPVSALDDLGPIRIRKVVREWLKEKFSED